MNKKVKTGFKIFGISLGIFVLTMGAVVFIMFLAGAFSPKKQELGNMYFTVNDEYNENNTYVIDSESFIKVIPTPEDSTEIDMELTILESEGNEIITIPDTYKIGRPIKINPVTEKITYNGQEYNINKGGIVTLKAKSTIQPLECSCKIIVDTFVEDYDIKFTDEFSNTLYQSEDKSAFIKYVRDDLNGSYYKDETGYHLINQNDDVQEKYSQYTDLIYQGTVFYAEIDMEKLFPKHSLNLFAQTTITNIYKEFNVLSSDSNVVEIEMENTNSHLKPRAKITVKETNDFNIGSTLIYSYINVLKKQQILNREDLDDIEKARRISELLVQSNEYNFKVNPIQITGIEVKNTEIGTSENFVENGTYILNSTSNNISNSYGIGLILKAPINSSYNDSELNSRLNEVEITTGYYKDGNFITSKEFIEVEKNISNEIVYLTLKCYKVNTIYQSVIKFSINDFVANLNVNFAEQEYPTFNFSEQNDLQLSLMIGMENEIIDLSKYDLISNKDLNDDEIIRYFIMDNGKVDDDNNMLENINGMLGYYEYIVDNNGLYGYDQENKEYKLIKDMPNYNGVFYSYVFRNGYIKLKDTASLADLIENNAVIQIKACIIKKDFYGDLISYQHNKETNEGSYGYYQGKIMPIDDILQDAEEYIGKRYNEGLYDYVESENCVYISIGQYFNIEDVKIVDSEDIDKEITSDEIVFDKSKFESERTIYLTITEDDILNIKLMHNHGTNYGELSVSKNSEQNFTLEKLTADNVYNKNDYILLKLSALKSNNNYEMISLTIKSNDSNSQNNELDVIKLYIRILSNRLSEMELKANNANQLNIVGKINNNKGTMEWVTENDEPEVKFTLTYLPKKAELEVQSLEFKVYRIVNENGEDTKILDDSIITLTATKDQDGNIVITSTIKKFGNVIIQAVYTDEFNGETRIVTSNELYINISVPNITFKEYKQNIQDGNIDVVDSKLIDKDFILGSYIDVYQTDDVNKTPLNSNLLSFEMVNNDVSNELFTLTNGKLILSRQIDKTYIVNVKVGTVFGALVKNDLGEDIYLNITVRPDISVEAIGTKDGEIYTNNSGLKYKFENNKLTVEASYNLIDITELLVLTNSENSIIEIAGLSKSSENTNISIDGLEIKLNQTSNQNTVTISYIINDGTAYVSIANIVITLDIVDSVE